MASGYALPLNGGSHHAHSHSYSGAIHLSPNPAASNVLLASNGSAVKKAVSNGSLYTHTESSRETSPLPTRLPRPLDGHEHNAFALAETAHLPLQVPSPTPSPMKARPRGESDLGRPAEPRSAEYLPALESIPAAPPSWFSLPEALTSLLVPLPYILASAAYSSTPGYGIGYDFPPFPAYARQTVPVPTSMQHDASGQGPVVPEFTDFNGVSAVIKACAITSGSLLVVGLCAKSQHSERVLDRRKNAGKASQLAKSLSTLDTMRAIALRAVSVGLPLYASMQIGGMRVGLILLLSIAADLTYATASLRRSFFDGLLFLKLNKATVAMMVLCLIADLAGLTFQASYTDVTLGYLALACSVLVLPPPLPAMAAVSHQSNAKATSPIVEVGTWSNSGRISAVSPLIRSGRDVNITLTTGALLSLATLVTSTVWSVPLSITSSTVVFSILSIFAMASTLLFSQPDRLRSDDRVGLGIGCMLTACCSFLFSPDIWPGTVCNGGISALSFLGVWYDSNTAATHRHHDDQVHEHAYNTSRNHHHHQPEGRYSMFTKLIMARCEPGSLVYGILSEKDSRRIAYFTTLNFGFMLVQAVYGYLSGSLGLLSDTVHMFFDCLGLVVGLGAAVASKWPTSLDKPYGWGKLNTLAGFGNGVFLMLVSVEFVWEAIEGIFEAKELRHVQELLVVSILGFLVNMVGLFAFGHAHAGHDHGHSHAHPPANLDRDDGHANGHAHGPGCQHNHEPKAHAGHEHDHHNENMEGIFLHVAADAGGSLAVIISTALSLWRPWYLWDPLATIIIAILIFAMAVPLVTSSGQKLLLVIPDELEYSIKNTLQELGELRGVVGYAVPRFWVDDKERGGDTHDHHHHHHHDHAHGHDHGDSGGKQKVMGVIHIIAAHSTDLEDVRERVDAFVRGRNMDLVIHVEQEADGRCWCGGGQRTG